MTTIFRTLLNPIWLVFMSAIGIDSRLPWCTVCCGQDAGHDAEQKSDEQREHQLRQMTKCVADLRITMRDGAATQFTAEPQLRYDDPVRQIEDASVWFLGRSGRPAAVLSIELYPGAMMYEFTATSECPQAVEGQQWAWRPSHPSFEWIEIKDAPAPGASPAARQQQMRSIMRGYEGIESTKREPNPITLRLLSQPIHRYADADRKVIDGAAFALVYGTNVETVAFLEAIETTGRQWQIGFARMAGAELEVRDKTSDRVIWSAPRLDGRDGPQGASWSYVQSRDVKVLPQ